MKKLKRNHPVQVLPVQASPVLYALLSGALRPRRDITLLPGVSNPAGVRDRILEHHPDVILLDLALPEVAGAELLRDLREHHPIPVIACSGSSAQDAQRALTVIEQGVLDVVVLPSAFGAEQIRQLGDELALKIHAAVDAAHPVPTPRFAEVPAAGLSFHAAGIHSHRHLIVIGASTGGTEALRILLTHMPSDAPAIAIVQHMPAFFTPAFAERLNLAGPLRVGEAVNGQRLHPGRAVIARGDTHLTVRRDTRGWVARYTHQRRVNRHCPSVDELFDSAVQAAGRYAVGILLTGMGADGARGLLRLREAGALTVAQDAESCAVFGMPKAAQELGAAELIGPPQAIARLVVQALAGRQRCSASAPAARH